jgi:carbonic anhydrase
MSGSTDQEGASGRVGRREALFLGGGAVGGALIGAGGTQLAVRDTSPERRDDSVTLTVLQARRRLEEGNARFRDGKSEHPDQSTDRRGELTDGQSPFAVVIACSDSRVIPETLFDQGLGDLFVIRTAGQVLDDVALGSIQYAVEHLGVELVIMLGHTSCGAVTAAVEAVESGAEDSGTPIDSLIEAIRPAVVQARATGAEGDRLLHDAILVNIDRGVAQLRGTPSLRGTEGRTTQVVGARYRLDDGGVDWFD